MKRTLDVVVAVLVLLGWLPLLLVIAILVKVDSPGPVLFRQRRYGKALTPFTALKFRTMVSGAPTDLHREFIEQLVRGDDPGDPERLKKLVDDPRVTRVGRILRRLSLDEVPQLLNVVAGHMSLIGPRPAIDYELEHYQPRHFERFTVRPGLSGLWQVSGRNRLGFREMLDLDVEYARTCSLATDVRVLLRTPRAMFDAAA